MADVVGKVDVTLIPPGPGAWRQPASPEPTARYWDAADASLTIGDIADDERDSIAEIGILVRPYARDGEPFDASIELTAEDARALIGALQAVLEAHTR